jgi:predicted N-formylglutamate amidohydrolase
VFLITCEHASPALPDGVELGVGRDVLETHVSYDRGAKQIAIALARTLSAPLHLGSFTRLLVDLNRAEENPAVIVASSYGIDIPANAALDERGRTDRIARWHRPYREAARRDAHELAGRGFCLHLSIHSFEPALDPIARAFDAGVLFDPSRDPEASIAEDLARGLEVFGHSVRRNEPYAGTPEGLTSWLRAQIPADRYVGIEIEACYRWMGREGSLEEFAANLAQVVKTAR